MAGRRIEPAMMLCMVCKAGMDWKKAHYECPRCHWIKPCCEPDVECVIEG